jgi:ferric-dicitrate binding protein FerR (iron transport regulator)
MAEPRKAFVERLISHRGALQAFFYADEFNRYGPSVFEIDDETLRALPITGVFGAYDADSFADPSAPREPLPVAR